jgi:hypothetical protein
MDSDLGNCPRHHLALGLEKRQAVLNEVSVAEREKVEDLGVWTSVSHAVALEAPGKHEPVAVEVGEQQIVDDLRRNLVAQRGRAHGVAKEEKAGHAARQYRASAVAAPCRTRSPSRGR